MASQYRLKHLRLLLLVICMAPGAMRMSSCCSVSILMLFFAGDLADGDLRLTRIARLPFPVAVILGNHDRGVTAVAGSLSSNLPCSAIATAPGGPSSGPSSR